jgi:hypothetical protein
LGRRHVVTAAYLRCCGKLQRQEREHQHDEKGAHAADFSGLAV